MLSPIEFAILAKSNRASMPSSKILLWQKWSAFLWLSGCTQRIAFCEEVLQNPCALRVSECMPFCPFSNLVWGTPLPSQGGQGSFSQKKEEVQGDLMLHKLCQHIPEIRLVNQWFLQHISVTLEAPCWLFPPSLRPACLLAWWSFSLS